MRISKQTIPWYTVINCGGIEFNRNRFESLPEISPGVSHCQRSAATPNAGCRTYREEGALNPWHLGARYRMGSIQRFSGLLRQIFLRGVGGLNPWHLWARYRTWSHPQIFFQRGGYLIIQTRSGFSNAAIYRHKFARCLSTRPIYFPVHLGARLQKDVAKFRVGGWGGGVADGQR